MYPFKQSFKSMNSENGANKEEPQHQWPLNPAAYQNVCNDEVDWAALAQQWIYMKETCPYEGMPEAPPPPNISKTISKQECQEYEEKGEAPMEVEKEDEQVNENATFIDTTSGNLIGSDLSDAQNVPNWGATGWNSHGWRKKPGWNTWTNPNMAASSSQTMIHHIRPQPLLPDPNMYNDIDLRTTEGYWSSNQRFPATKSSHIHSGSNHGDHSPKSNSDSQSEPFSLDAAKRKTLPAWIRQGLEKMEREKQKVAEKERERKERLANQQRANEEHSVNAIPGDIAFNAKSKFDSESDSDDDIKEQKISVSTSNRILNPVSVIAKRPQKSKQEQLQDLMLMVRQTLTEILLEVTNEEIKSIASDTLSKKRSKARKAQPVRKTALSSLTGGLGLGIYADSDNSGNSSSDDSNDESQSDEIDSDIDLKESLKRRKLAFELKEKEIEAALAIEAEKEKRWLDDGNDETTNVLVNNEGNPGTSSADKDTGEIQHENYLRTHGTRREKKASRFSDPTDTVNNLRVAHGSIIYELKQSGPTKIDTTKIPFVQTPQYDEHKDSDSSSNSSKRQKRRKSNNSSSGDSEPDTRYYNGSRKGYNRSKDKSRNRSRSSSSERSHRLSSYSNRSRGSPNRKSYHYEDRATSSSKDMHKVSSSYRDDRTRSYSNSSSKDSYSRKRSRSRSSSKTRKYNYSRY